MAFCFTVGTHLFRNPIEGQENTTVQCWRCGNWSAHLVKDWEFFTFCFVPLIPFSLKPWPTIFCPICGNKQAIDSRPDVKQMMENGGNSSSSVGTGGGQIPLQGGPPQGWNNNSNNSKGPQQPSQLYENNKASPGNTQQYPGNGVGSGKPTYG